MTVRFIEPRRDDPRLNKDRRYRMVINGRDVDAASGKTVKRESSVHEGLVVGEWPEASREDVETAIAAARRAFDEGPWPSMSGAERAAIVGALVDHVEASADTLVPTMVAEAGQPTMFAEGMQLRSGVALARNTIDLYLSMTHEDFNPVPVDELVTGRVALSIRRHEPVGVVTAITPYNAAVLMNTLEALMVA